jgi:hypothetical protein
MDLVMEEIKRERGWVSGSFPKLQLVDARRSNTFVLQEPVQYVTDRFPSLPMITVPAGFLTDLASIPRILPMALSKNRIQSAAIVHDWLYRNTEVIKGQTRKKVDLIFKDAMIDNGVARFRASLYYSAVRSFGWISYADS